MIDSKEAGVPGRSGAEVKERDSQRSPELADSRDSDVGSSLQCVLSRRAEERVTAGNPGTNS